MTKTRYVFEVDDTVKVKRPRGPYRGMEGVVAKLDTREGRPYIGVRFGELAGTLPSVARRAVAVFDDGHIVWFFEDELS